MTRIDFYFNAPDKADVARRLVAKAYAAGLNTLIYTADPALAGALDTTLWTAQQRSFLPHVRCGHPLARRTPVLIGAEPGELNTSDLIINLADECPSCFGRFERLIEIVAEDDPDRQRARERFRFYKERGYPLETHDLAK